CFQSPTIHGLEDLQITDRVGKRATKPGLNFFRRERVELFAIGFRKVELALAHPCVDKDKIVSDRHRQLVYRRLVLISGRESREVSQQDRGSAKERQPVFDRL